MGWKTIKNRRGEEITVYDSSQIRQYQASFYFIMSGMSAGKTFDGLDEILSDYLKSMKTKDPVKGVIMRRYDTELKGITPKNYFKPLVDEGRLVGTGFDDIVFKSDGWYLSKYDEDLDKYITENKPFCYAFALNTPDKVRGAGYPECKTVVFDELIPLKDTSYLKSEFRIFIALLNRIFRQDERYTVNGVNQRKVWLYMNTTSVDCPYFHELGIGDPSLLKQGEITVVRHRKNKQQIQTVVEWLSDKKENTKKVNSNDIFYDFPGANCLTSGGWGYDRNYPMLPLDYEDIYKQNVLYTYYIAYENGDRVYRCDICSIEKDNEESLFTYIHLNNLSIEEDAVIYSLIPSPDIHFRRNLSRPYDKLGQWIFSFFQRDWVMYDSNYTGETIMNYLKRCNQITPIGY